MRYTQTETAHTKHVKQFSMEWPDFVRHLFEHSSIEAKPEEKDYTQAFASCILKPDCDRRKKVNVERMSSFVAFDLDSHFYVEELTHAMQGVEFVAYTTTKSVIDSKRWRIVVRLTDEYEAVDHLLVWHFFNEIFWHKLDENTKDLTRLSFFPRNWTKSNAEIHHSEGHPFDVAELVASGWIPSNIDTMLTVQTSPTEEEDFIYLMSESIAPIGDPIFTDRLIEKFFAEKKGGALLSAACPCRYPLQSERLVPERQRSCRSSRSA